ncbi:Protein of unknown function [Streptomyces sp. DvalAA-14]|uniref:DUF2637 domain-containing protein n=1 Tax=unclassified Streptomyces TaxID=2593676 RepID=UPI00081BC318|nr:MULTISPECIES: DUF2637 domain-containing protein [unclassified Streptomyces]MYS23577.1 DUF2637 domain-containing protein [Streptomyces sp. SID4948]SCE35634.1 Protein of unknown function [Streptomyces sp. DvalAA-14]
MTKHTAERYALAAAGAVIVVLTAGGFWLSYAHLAEVAGQHGLRNSPLRQWTWPATLDAFIVAGELLMLRAGLRNEADWWAIGLTAAGSVGSIALNVAGVSGTGNAAAVPLLDYIVAAVPPTAALLAFGVLMRQIHRLVTEPGGTVASISAQPTEPPSGDPAPPARKGRPADATVEELVEIGRIAVAEQGRASRAVVQQAIRDEGLKVGGQRLTQAMHILRSELSTGQGDE